MSSEDQSKSEGRRRVLWEVIGGTIVGGLAVAVAAPFIEDWIRAGVKAQGLQGFWLPIVLVVGVALTAVAALVFLTVSLISPKGRARWARVCRWLWSWRPITARRHARSVEYLVKALAESNVARSRLAERADEAIDQVRESIPKVALHLSEQMGEEKQRVDVIMNAVEDLTKQVEALRAKAAPPTGAFVGEKGMAREKALNGGGSSSAKAAVKEFPPPPPRWKLVEISTDDDDLNGVSKFRLMNLVPGSVARNVRMESGDIGSFSFDDAATWADLSGQAQGEFSGEIVETDKGGRAKLSMSWLNHNGTPQSVSWTITQRPPF